MGIPIYYPGQNNWDRQDSWRRKDAVRSCYTGLDHERSAPSTQPLNTILALRTRSSTSNSVLSTSWFSAVSIFFGQGSIYTLLKYPTAHYSVCVCVCVCMCVCECVCVCVCVCVCERILSKNGVPHLQRLSDVTCPLTLNTEFSRHNVTNIGWHDQEEQRDVILRSAVCCINHSEVWAILGEQILLPLFLMNEKESLRVFRGALQGFVTVAPAASFVTAPIPRCTAVLVEVIFFWFFSCNIHTWKVKKKKG